MCKKVRTSTTVSYHEGIQFATNTTEVNHHRTFILMYFRIVPSSLTSAQNECGVKEMGIEYNEAAIWGTKCYTPPQPRGGCHNHAHTLLTKLIADSRARSHTTPCAHQIALQHLRPWLPFDLPHRIQSSLPAGVRGTCVHGAPWEDVGDPCGEWQSEWGEGESHRS